MVHANFKPQANSLNKTVDGVKKEAAFSDSHQVAIGSSSFTGLEFSRISNHNCPSFRIE